METYSPPEGATSGATTAAEIDSLLKGKARELFVACDPDGKGSISKQDLRALQGELSLTGEQLDAVFDSLDDDANGFLTLEEFTDGFGSYLGMSPTTAAAAAAASQSASCEAAVFETTGRPDAERTGDAAEFDEMIATLDAQRIFEDVEVIRTLWNKLQNNNPELLSGFEEFLGRVTTELKSSQSNCASLETVIRKRSSAHDEEVRKLFEEMEYQIKSEKERLAAEDTVQMREARHQLETELQGKNQELQDLISSHSEMERRMLDLSSSEIEMKHENNKLVKEKNDLEDQYFKSRQSLEESVRCMNELRRQQDQHKHQSAIMSLQVNEGMLLEKESLMKQLNMLKDMNRKLRDGRDEAERRANLSSKQTCGIFHDNSTDDPSHQSSFDEMETHTRSRHRIEKRGSVMSDYFGSSSKPTRLARGQHYDGYVDADDMESFDENGAPYNGDLRAAIRDRSANLSDGDSDVEFDLQSPRGQPVGANSSGEMAPRAEVTKDNEDLSRLTPERLFKVVFVGDSGVGKSCFINRFCNNSFRATFCTTIGVDFQMKTMRVDGHVVSLQLWDTAGQERFRSITKQYFRKADGVIVVYDLLSEVSFKNVRSWMSSVKEGCEEDTVFMLLGNKIDLVEEEEGRVVTTKAGAYLADEYDALFYETSAKSGIATAECMQALATLMRDKEDASIQKAITLETTKAQTKKGCCN